nr:MAG TPA: hypothetical protein [Bacteriophage sp.]
MNFIRHSAPYRNDVKTYEHTVYRLIHRNCLHVNEYCQHTFDMRH